MKIVGLSHVSLFVRDVDASRAFYRDYLGFAESYSLNNDDGSLRMTVIKISDAQVIELVPKSEPIGDRLNHVALRVNDANAKRLHLKSHGVAVPDETPIGLLGNANFFISDPDGRNVEIVQYLPSGRTMREDGKSMPPTRISTRMSHAGILVGDVPRSLAFYCGVLGFRETWRGSRDGVTLSWINVTMPGSDDYLELMLYETLPPPNERGGRHHICLEVPSVPAALETLSTRPRPASCPQPTPLRIGRNGKRQSNLFDPDGTRVELMEPITADGQPVPPSTAPCPTLLQG